MPKDQQIGQWTFRVAGLSPGLLMHSPKGMAAASGKAKRKTIPSPAEEAEGSIYHDNGHLVVPSIAFRSCVLRATTGFRLGKTAAKVLVSAAIVGSDDCFVLTRSGKPIAKNDYEIDTRRAVVQRQGILRSRAMIPAPWELEGQFPVDLTMGVTGEMLEEFLQRGGRQVGILDFRPEKQGWFGRFEVIKSEL